MLNQNIWDCPVEDVVGTDKTEGIDNNRIVVGRIQTKIEDINEGYQGQINEEGIIFNPQSGRFLQKSFKNDDKRIDKKPVSKDQPAYKK